jgi:hypothetical protein
VSDKDKADDNDPYQFNFPATMAPEDVLRIVFANLKRTRAGMEGAVSLIKLRDDPRYSGHIEDDIQILDRCLELEKRVINAVQEFLVERGDIPRPID